MKVNNKSSIGPLEDLIVSCSNLIATEMHMMAIIRVVMRDLEDAQIEQNHDEMMKQMDKISHVESQLDKVTDLRRKKMVYIEETFGDDVDPYYWCSVKHMMATVITTFETLQAGENVLDQFIAESNLLAELLSDWLGFPFGYTDCFACLSDMLKGKT